MLKRFAGWWLAGPATLAVLVFLVLPVAATIATTFGEDGGIFAPYIAFFNSGFRRTVLWRTIEISLATTAISLVVGFLTAYVVSKSPGKLKSLLIIAAVFPLLTGVAPSDDEAWTTSSGMFSSTPTSVRIISGTNR